ncbi:hypothetical protein [uncultured Hymenobacter sp.]|uniref:hypothetical protein n=1 Tax=uncultured Hymenobacter sp. TaxID=170016 RepID=UPI0035CBB1EE
MEKKDVQHQQHLDGAIKLLSGDLVEEASRAGFDNQLQRWIGDLKEVNNPALHELIVDMQALKAHFGSGTFDKDVIAGLLTKLGKNTSLAANFAENTNTATRVTKLGEVLTAVAQQFKGAADAPDTIDGSLPQDYSSHR